MLLVDELRRQRFEATWYADCPLPIHQFLPPVDDAQYIGTLLELVCIDLENRWKRWAYGRDAEIPECEAMPTCESYFLEFPELNRSDLRKLIAQDQEQLVQQFAARNISTGSRRQPTHVAHRSDPSIINLSDNTKCANAEASDLSGDSSTVIGDYQLLELLGQGGMGAVYKARHLRLGRFVALKILRSDRVPDNDNVARFKREITAIGRLPPHPNLVLATDARQIDKRQILIMDFLEGVDLARLVARHGPLRVSDACEVVRQAAEGLTHIVAHGLVHRDIKPSNLMITTDGLVRVLDLGLARIVPRSPERLTELTEEGELMGTPDFMAPEQWLDSRQVDRRADLYSLGCTLFFLLCGKAPFGDTPPGALLAKQQAHLKAPVPSLSACRPDIPESLQALISQLMSKSASDRPQLPDVVVKRLAKWCQGADLRKLLSPVSAKHFHSDGVADPVNVSTVITDCRSSEGLRMGAQTSEVHELSSLSIKCSDSERAHGLSLQMVGTPFVYTASAAMQEIIVGRQRRRAGCSDQQGCDFVIRLPDSDERNLRISRQHFRIRRTDREYLLQDQSRAGTVLNGRRLSFGEESRVQPGDRILMADLVEILVLSEAAESQVFESGSLIASEAGTRCGQLILEVSVGDLRTMEPSNDAF